MAEPSRPARLWYQSFVHPTEQAPYIERLQALLDAAAGPGIRFEVHGLDPPDHLFHPLTEFRCAAQTIRNALDAERAGYDAFVIGHFQETGLLEIRGAVDMPVVGLGEATLLAALSMGRQLGLVTIDRSSSTGTSGRCERTASSSVSPACGRFTWTCPVSCAPSPTIRATRVSAPTSWNRCVRWSAAGARSSSRRAACRCCCLRASAHSLSTPRWCSTASRWWQRPRRWRWRYGASPARWSAAAGLTPRYRRHAWRSTSQGAGESAAEANIDADALVAAWARGDVGNAIVLKPLVPPHVDRHLGPP